MRNTQNLTVNLHAPYIMKRQPTPRWEVRVWNFKWRRLGRSCIERVVMNTARRLGFRKTVITLGVALALAIVVTSNAPVHASSAPDLEVGTPTADNSITYTGTSFTLSATVTNAGDGESVATTLRYYRSTDTTITTSDTEVGTDAVGALAASGASDQSIDLTAPSTAGTYYYGACVDSVFGESDTSDNCSAALTVTVNLPPDLSMTRSNRLRVSKPSGFVPGGTFYLRSVVDNAGDGASTATTVRYYHSTDTTVTTSDTEVGTSAVGAIAAGSLSTQSIELTAPSTAGSYYYGACVDTVPGESDTTNNCSSAATLVVPEPGPDLSLDHQPSLSGDSSSPGGSFTLTVYVSNPGLQQSGATTLRYYQSTDTTTTPSGDTQVSTLDVPALGARHHPVAMSVGLTAPSTVGTYYYYGCVDAVTDETNMTNNCSQYVTVSLENTPATGAPTISGTAQVGQTLTASTTGISDPDGLTNVTYSYQWLADDAVIDGATSSTYTVQSTDNGKVIKVRVTFTDDGGSDESLTSAGTSAVVMGGL